MLVAQHRIHWTRWSLQIRCAPVLLLFVAAAAQRLDGGSVGPWFQVLQPTLIALAAAAFILALFKDSPEAERLKSPILRFFGDISYGVYLTHLAVLGLMHGFLLGGEPDFSTGAQRLVTLAAAIVTLVMGWAITRYVEQPVTAWGRSFRWR